MALGPDQEWIDTFNALPADTTGALWAPNFASAVDTLTTNKLSIGNVAGTPPVFTFNKPAFEAALNGITNGASDATGFALALQTGLNASTMEVFPGASVPGGTYATVISTIFDLPSIVSAINTLTSDLNAVPSTAPDAGPFAVAFRKAFLTLTCTTTGTNGDGDPLVNAMAAVI